MRDNLDTIFCSRSVLLTSSTLNYLKQNTRKHSKKTEYCYKIGQSRKYLRYRKSSVLLLYQSNLLITYLIYFFLEPCFKAYFVTPFESATKSHIKLKCNMTSHFKPNYTDIYWLKNGFKKIRLNEDHTSISIVSLRNNLSLIQSYNSILEIQMHRNYSVQGYYQCVIFTPMFMTQEARSQKLQLQFQGNIFPFNRLLYKTQ